MKLWNWGHSKLENRASNSTWVISSKNAFNAEMFGKFLTHYVHEKKSINDLKSMYDGKSSIKFKTKNHEKSEQIDVGVRTKWVAGVLGKIIS
ncbi:MAG: hypothetical protein IE885_09225 [Campylobacterales bacterium]|nr:hypothetical protein [Campylobacterales bacterium]